MPCFLEPITVKFSLVDRINDEDDHTKNENYQIKDEDDRIKMIESKIKFRGADYSKIFISFLPLNHWEKQILT